MQQIEIEIVSAEAGEARLTSTRDAISGHEIGLHLGDQEYAVTLTGNYVANPRNPARRANRPSDSGVGDLPQRTAMIHPRTLKGGALELPSPMCGRVRCPTSWSLRHASKAIKPYVIRHPGGTSICWFHAADEIAAAHYPARIVKHYHAPRHHLP